MLKNFTVDMFLETKLLICWGMVVIDHFKIIRYIEISLKEEVVNASVFKITCFRESNGEYYVLGNRMRNIIFSCPHFLYYRKNRSRYRDILSS